MNIQMKSWLKKCAASKRALFYLSRLGLSFTNSGLALKACLTAPMQQLRDIPAERLIGRCEAAVLGGGAWVLVRGAELGGAEPERE